LKDVFTGPRPGADNWLLSQLIMADALGRLGKTPIQHAPRARLFSYLNHRNKHEMSDMQRVKLVETSKLRQTAATAPVLATSSRVGAARRHGR
jgi:hypothetical protein